LADLKRSLFRNPVGPEEAVDAYMVVPSNRRQRFTLGNYVHRLDGRLFHLRPAVFRRTLFFDEWLKGGVDFEDPFLEFLVRFFEGCTHPRILQRDFPDLVVFLR
jgi:hypothetical protein